MTDREFAAYLRNKDLEWTHKKISEDQNIFFAKGKLVGIDKYKNSQPVDQWFFIPKRKGG